jgi:hypothetical protein
MLTTKSFDTFFTNYHENNCSYSQDTGGTWISEEFGSIQERVSSHHQASSNNYDVRYSGLPPDRVLATVRARVWESGLSSESWMSVLFSGSQFWSFWEEVWSKRARKNGEQERIGVMPRWTYQTHLTTKVKQCWAWILTWMGDHLMLNDKYVGCC